MGSSVVLSGNFTYSVNASNNTVLLQADRIENFTDRTTGTIRLELWLTTTPWSSSGSGYKIAVDLLTIAQN